MCRASFSSTVSFNGRFYFARFIVVVVNQVELPEMSSRKQVLSTVIDYGIILHDLV